MKAPLSTVLAGVTAVYAAANCGNGNNNCQRALLSTKLPNRNPISDCNSYFRVTVTPATSTVTTTKFTASLTTTTTTRTEVKIDKKKRGLGIMEQIAARQATRSASNIPAYASPCSGAARYSSACSCIGATVTTVTVAAPVTTITTTATTTTATATVTSTTTRLPDFCDGPFQTAAYVNAVIPGSNLNSNTVGSSSASDCCRTCRATAGCIYWDYQSESCYYVAEASGTCPSGQRTVFYSPGDTAYLGFGECGKSYASGF